MARKSMLARALGFAQKTEEAAPAEPTPEIEEIFQAIRSGEAPWNADELPGDARRATKLLFELDRAWLRPSG